MKTKIVGFLALFSALAMPGYAYRVSAWVPSWDSAATPIMQVQAGNLDEANPTWYNAVADGTITKNWNAENASLRAALSGVALLPTIQNYSDDGFAGAMMATIVNSPTLREKHAEAIAQLVVQNAFDGIDIDYESMPSTSRSGFSAFVTLLASKLHASGKLLSVTVYANTGNATWDGPAAQDWAVIGAAADSVKIMAYDYHWATSSAGAISPLDWLDAVAAYAEKTLPPGKALMGLPWYGYDWLGNRADGVTYAEAMARAQSAGASIQRDANGEATFTYSGHTVYFQDAASYRRKVEAILAKHPGIGGFAHWRVGAEDPAIWDVVAQLRGGGSAPIEPAVKDFAIVGASRLDVVAGASASAAFSYVSINGFDETVSVTATALDAFGGTAAFTTSVLARNGATTLTVHVPSTTAPGTYRVRVAMTGSAASHEQIVNVNVSAPAVIGDFAVAAPESVRVIAGSRADVPVTLSPLDGFRGTATVSVRKLDAFSGMVALTESALDAGGSATLIVTADKRTAAGTYRVQITATSGTMTRTRIVEVTIQTATKRRAVR